jgi:ABC-type branched-subunit amino acid transport system ATPase component
LEQPQIDEDVLQMVEENRQRALQNLAFRKQIKEQELNAAKELEERERRIRDELEIAKMIAENTELFMHDE